MATAVRRRDEMRLCKPRTRLDSREVPTSGSARWEKPFRPPTFLIRMATKQKVVFNAAINHFRRQCCRICGRLILFRIREVSPEPLSLPAFRNRFHSILFHYVITWYLDPPFWLRKSVVSESDCSVWLGCWHCCLNAPYSVKVTVRTDCDRTLLGWLHSLRFSGIRRRRWPHVRCSRAPAGRSAVCPVCLNTSPPELELILSDSVF